MSLSAVHSNKGVLLTIAALLTLCVGCSDHEASSQRQSNTSQQQSTNLPTENPGSHIEVFDVPIEWMTKWNVGLNDDEFQLAQELALKGVEQETKLKAKFQKIISNPQAFSTDDINNGFDDLLKLTVNMNLLNWIKGADRKRQPITLNPTINVWGLFDDHIVNPGSVLDNGITSLAKRAAIRPGCDLAYMQMKEISPLFWYEYTLAKVEAERQTCNGLHYFLTTHNYLLPKDQQNIGWLDKNWQEQTERVKKLKEYVGNEKYSFLHKALVDGVDGGCEHGIQSLANVLNICPWRVNTDRSEFPKEMLDKDKSHFKYFPIELKNDASKVEAESAINIMAQKLVGGSVDSSFAALKDTRFYPMGYWVSSDQTKVVFKGVSRPKTIAYDNSRPRYIPFTLEQTILISATSKESRYLYVPSGYGQYDDGQIIGITDQDKDGNIEVWISATMGECDGDGEELRPGIDCAIPHHYMAEQFGNYLGGFVQGPSPQIPFENKHE